MGLPGWFYQVGARAPDDSARYECLFSSNPKRRQGQGSHVITSRNTYECVRTDSRDGTSLERCRATCNEEKQCAELGQTCPICLEVMTVVVALPCMHRFCKPCIEQNYSSGRSAQRMCPVCRKVFDPSSDVRRDELVEVRPRPRLRRPAATETRALGRRPRSRIATRKATRQRSSPSSRCVPARARTRTGGRLSRRRPSAQSKRIGAALFLDQVDEHRLWYIQGVFDALKEMLDESLTYSMWQPSTRPEGSRKRLRLYSLVLDRLVDRYQGRIFDVLFAKEVGSDGESADVTEYIEFLDLTEDGEDRLVILMMLSMHNLRNLRKLFARQGADRIRSMLPLAYDNAYKALSVYAVLNGLEDAVGYLIDQRLFEWQRVMRAVVRHVVLSDGDGDNEDFAAVAQLYGVESPEEFSVDNIEHGLSALAAMFEGDPERRAGMLRAPDDQVVPNPDGNTSMFRVQYPLGPNIGGKVGALLHQIAYTHAPTDRGPRTAVLSLLAFILRADPATPLLRNPDGHTALHLACAAGNVGVADALLDVSDVNAIDKEGFTPVFYLWSVWNTNTPMPASFLQHMLNAGLDLNHRWRSSAPTLMHATIAHPGMPVSRKVEALNLIVKHGKGIDYTRRHEGMTYLEHAFDVTRDLGLLALMCSRLHEALAAAEGEDRRGLLSVVGDSMTQIQDPDARRAPETVRHHARHGGVRRHGARHRSGTPRREPQADPPGGGRLRPPGDR